MSPLFRDPHPTCARCRGRSCSSTSTCKVCDGWSLDQWEHFRLKRAYAGRSKSFSRHSGDPIETASNPPTPPPPFVHGLHEVRFARASLPPPSEGLGEGREALGVVDIKEPRVSPSQSVVTTATPHLPARGLPHCGHCPQGTRASTRASCTPIMSRQSSAGTALARWTHRSTPAPSPTRFGNRLKSATTRERGSQTDRPEHTLLAPSCGC